MNALAMKTKGLAQNVLTRASQPKSPHQGTHAPCGSYKSAIVVRSMNAGMLQINDLAISRSGQTKGGDDQGARGSYI
jgi:hypothetical protein